MKPRSSTFAPVAAANGRRAEGALGIPLAITSLFLLTVVFDLGAGAF
jgi:hypothetical protein